MLYKCPCGDQPVAIPDERLAETYLDGAFWCSTVMSLLNFDGSVKYVWNPFSLQQLKAKLGAFDTYLECVASKNSGDCVPPTDEIFKKQQIPMLSVYQRCLSNYQEMTWDQGTHVLFNRTLQRTIKLDKLIPEVQDTFNVSVRLLEAKSKGYDNTAVLDIFLGGSQATDYFKYSNITNTNPGSAQVDACLTFSGPSQLSDPKISQPFTACLESYANRSGCDIPHMLWSGRSTNKVPVATQHTLTITDPAVRLKMASGEMDATQNRVLQTLDELEKKWTGDKLKITIFSADGDLLHQYADCVMQGPMGSMTLTPGPDGVEKIVWSRSSDGGPSRLFELPCSGERLTNRDGITRDDTPPFTCGTRARRAIVKHFLRVTYGGEKENQGAKNSVINEIRALINRTREAWNFKSNFMCTCPNSTTTGWACCEKQKDCATEPCPCPDGYSTKASVACCTSVCGGLAGAGIMEPFSKIKGEKLATDLLESVGSYMKNDIWTSTAPWLKFDPLGAESYKASWQASQFEVEDAGLFDASNPVVYYDEITYPMRATFWEHCAGLLQQVIWTMPVDRATGRPKIPTTKFDPVTGKSQTPNITYTEEFIQSMTLEAYKSSPLFWHYNVRHSPSPSEVCKRSTPRRPMEQPFSAGVSGTQAIQMGFASMTLGGLGGADCYCGWWLSSTECKIPDQLCDALVQILGFRRICVDQNKTYNSITDHRIVLAALDALKLKQPNLQYPCPALRVSEHWGLMDTSTGTPFSNTTDAILREGVGGFRLGNTDWLLTSQTAIVNPFTRVNPVETPSTSAALDCTNATWATGGIVNHFIDELFPSAQGVRQSMPQSYCTRYGIELARLTVFKTAGLTSAASEQQGVVDQWRKRCQYKLEELAVCNSFKIMNATSGPTATAQCPFTLSVVNSLSRSYSVTPGCLLVIWNTQAGSQDGIYDPCICVSCAKTPNIDIPAQMTSMCKLESFQTLVAKDVIPGESDTGVPLGSGSFRTLMDKPGFLQINTPDITHWALHTSIRDADLAQDWWPEEWKHPVGYHVTPGCSRPGDARWRTFDTSWRWDSLQEQMYLAGDESNDPFLSRNAFGASGVCRANNFGMPLTILNTMTLCTKENQNAQSDPMVPAPTPSFQSEWVDGSENCAKDHTSTPWEVDRTVNPPNQWTVGTLHRASDNARLKPKSATEWGPDCGPYPLKTCRITDDCAQGLACMRSSGGNNYGVCGKLQTGLFECTAHIQCPNDQMCAGDGKCVDGIWQVRNNMDEPISFRTFSQECGTGTPLDTWGTSAAEGVQDILSASGLCSYRSWFENRRMAQRNECNQSETCAGFSGLQAWNFTSPKRKSTAGESAFDSQVLKVKAHVCDRDYHFMDDFISCTPNGNFARMYLNDMALLLPKGSTLETDNRTQTYRPGVERILPLMHHMENSVGPTYGFTGIPLTYSQLRLGDTNPSIVPCSSLRTCGFQPNFRVNGLQINQRLVIDGGRQRAYSMQDLLQCGVFGYQTEFGTCRLDYAVAPLAGFMLVYHGDQIHENEFAGIADLADAYTPDKTTDVWRMLILLPDLLLNLIVGGRPTSLQDYMDKSAKFEEIYSRLGQLEKPTYTDAGIPMQLYKLTQYGAYEIPFIWWNKCSWIGGFSMANDNPISSAQCSWKAPSTLTPPSTVFGPYDNRVADLLGKQRQPSSVTKNISLATLLMRLPGVVTRSIVDAAKTEFAVRRNEWIDGLAVILNRMKRVCFGRKEFVREFQAVSERYQAAIISQMYDDLEFNRLTPFMTTDNRTEVCRGDGCLRSTDPTTPTGTNSDLPRKLADALKAAAISTATVSISQRVIDNERAVIKELFSSATLSTQFWADIAVLFRNEATGCSETVTLVRENTPFACLCSEWEHCSSAVQKQMLGKAKITTTPSENEIPTIDMGTQGKADACNIMSEADEEGRCVLNDGNQPLTGINQTDINSIRMPPGLSMETYIEEQWDCVRLTCDSRSPDFNNKMVPAAFTSWSSRTVERVVIDEAEYQQHIPYDNLASMWSDAATEASELACDASKTRLQIRTEDAQTNGGNVWGASRVKRCRPTCNVKHRTASGLTTWRFKTTRAAYYVNDTLIDEVEFFPCLSGPQTSNADCRTIITNLITQHPYRQELRTLDLKLCSSNTDANGLPTNDTMLLALTRGTRSAAGLERLKGSLLAMKNVMWTINSKYVDEICVRNSKVCSMTDNNVAAELKIGELTQLKKNTTCQGIKKDPIYGCNLWPGELTATSKDSSRYSCTAIDEFETFEPNRACLADSADACRSPNPAFRDSQLSGRTLYYTLATTTPTCVAGPRTKCLLTDEASTLGSNRNAGCPSLNTSESRSKGYQTLVKFNRLFTTVTRQSQILSGDSVANSYGSGLAFDHMFVRMNNGYACSTSASYTCADPMQIPVQLRKRLWRCLDCPLISEWQCVGQHNCQIQSPQLQFDQLSAFDGWDKLPAASKSFLVDTDSDISDAIPAIVWLVSQIATLVLPDVRLSYERPSFMQSYRNAVDFSYNPIPILSYEKTMQRNTGSCADSAPDFSNCSYDGHRRDLIRFIDANYKVRDGTVIQPGDTLQWQMPRSQLTSHSIPHWSTTRGKQGMFMTDLLSADRCLSGSVMDNACYVHTDTNGKTTVDVLNPGMLGAFEPMAGCDTDIVNNQRVVSALCEGCVRSPVNEYLLLDDGETEMACSQKSMSVPGVTIDDRAESNLCSKIPASDSKCTRPQGMIGKATQSDGNPADDVYKRVAMPSNRFLPVGLRQNSLFSGVGILSQATLGNMVLSPDDIGGHFVRMVLDVTRSGGYALAVTGIPLSSYSDGLSHEAFSIGAAASDPSWLDADMDSEADAMRTLYPAPTCKAWDCPLRRRAFYMGKDNQFRPLVPDPLRTQMLYSSRAHPTQQAFALPHTLSQTTETRVLGQYTTSNGFCACEDPSVCTEHCQDDEPALTGGWVASSVAASTTQQQCMEQLDWPYAGGSLRDGPTSTSTPRWTTLISCGVWDRLPAFRYMYKNTERVTQSTKTTLDKGGVCHMGWPAVTAGPLAGCYLIPSDSTDTFMCPTFLQPKNVTRLRAKTIPELLSSPNRPRLSDCSPPPTYRINSTTGTPSEVSYGQLRRLEAARLLANDLRRRLCGNATVCQPAAGWSLGSFWASVYSRNAFNGIPSGNGENTSLWDTPWVACVQKNGTQTCDGIIKRSDWATGDRQRMCLDTLTNSPLAGNLSQDVNVCDLDEGMDQFCRTVQDARYQIFEANCLYSGQCRQKLFFYQPSTYAVDNGEFVRSTVQRFYNSTVEGACVPDQDTAQAIRDNAPNLAKCAAVQLNVLADCIQIIRVIIGALVELVYYMAQLMMTVFKLIGASKGAQEDAVVTELGALLKLMQNKFKLLFEQVGDLFYKILFEGPMGDWLISMITAICHFLEWLFSEVVYIVMCWVQKSTVWFLQTIANPFVDILNGISFGALNYLYSDITNAVTAVENNIPCTPQSMWSCNLNFNTSANRTTILPLPTRCWAGVEPGVSSLACTAADTCMTNDFGKVICGACPSPATTSMIRFGCDTLTKLCTCNVFPSDVTACASHEECTMAGGEVGCRYVDSYLQPSYGSVPCAQCQNPMCLITDGSGTGKCSCLLRPVPNQACSEPGQAVSPNAAQLCLAAISGGGGLGASNAYTQNYRVLVNVPCMLLNQAQSYCMQVYTSATSASPLVVGLALLHTGGRRRLLWSELIDDGMVQLEPNASLWDGRGEPCRSLIIANSSSMGILDKYAKGECWRWYDIGVHLTTEANMTGVSPFFLVSWHDMVNTMLDRGALVEILAKLPNVVHRLLLHTEALQPAYIMFTYWTAVLPKEVWVNQSMLDDAKRYLNNYTATYSTAFVESHASYAMTQPLGNDTISSEINHTDQTGRRRRNRRILSDEEAIGIPGRRASVSASTVIDTDVSSQTVYEWSQGPYSWPPNYVYWQGEKSCAMVSTALNVVRNGLESTIRFYQDPIPAVSPVVWPSLPTRKNISIVLPQFPTNLDLSSLTIKQVTEAAEEVLSNLTEQLLDKDQISSVLVDAPYLQTIKGLIQCNFTRIQTCEGRRPLFWSAVQSLLVVLLLGMIGRILDIPYIDALLVVAFVPIFMFITYGYSLTCTPMIPTCLLHDLFELVDYLLPDKIEWPEELVDYAGCRSPSCMRSCINDPVVGFKAWQDHLAWIMCEIDTTWSIDQATKYPRGDPFRASILRKCFISGDSMRSAQRICFAITIVRSAPIILLILLALWLIPSAGAIGLAAAQFVVNLMFTFVLFVHSDG